jgi:hypothetical protein
LASATALTWDSGGSGGTSSLEESSRVNSILFKVKKNKKENKHQTIG